MRDAPARLVHILRPMTTFRFVALLSLVGAPACYRDSPAPSTIRTTPFADEQHYMWGPPGGAMDTAPGTDALAPANRGFAGGDGDDDGAAADGPGAASPDGGGVAVAPGPAEGLV